MAEILEAECFKLAKENEYQLCVTDVFVHNNKAIEFWSSSDYRVYGSAYKSGYFPGRGYVDTIVYAKYTQESKL